MAWNNQTQMNPANFRCGFCSREVASIVGFSANHSVSRAYICPNCNGLNVFPEGPNGRQVPGPLVGVTVQALPADVAGAYDEARRCCAAGAYTGSVLLCRKLLMNIAVTHGADEGKSFAEYIQYLADQNFIPPNGKDWVDHIRKRGNDATHQIAIMSKDDAEDLITFSQSLLQFIYEFPNRLPKRQ